jgi:hypothetical protein
MLAERVDDPAAIAHAGFRLVHVLLGAGRLEEAAQVADAALARADGDMGSARVRSLVGAIYLPLAVTAARRSDEASAFLALDEAGRLADEVPPDVVSGPGSSRRTCSCIVSRSLWISATLGRRCGSRRPSTCRRFARTAEAGI